MSLAQQFKVKMHSIQNFPILKSWQNSLLPFSEEVQYFKQLSKQVSAGAD